MTKKRKNKKRTCLSDVKLRVMAEYASSGIWVIGQTGPFRHGGIGYSGLGLPKELAQRFEQWIEMYWGRLAEEYPEYAHLSFSAEEFNQIGRSLAKELKNHVGPQGMWSTCRNWKRAVWVEPRSWNRGLDASRFSAGRFA